MSTNKRVSRYREPLEAKKRRRLENLLYTRKRVAQLACQFASHGLDDAVELQLLQLELEQVIDDEYPQIFAQQLSTWIEDDNTWLHHPSVAVEGCSLCPQSGSDWSRPLVA